MHVPCARDAGSVSVLWGQLLPILNKALSAHPALALCPLPPPPPFFFFGRHSKISLIRQELPWDQESEIAALNTFISLYNLDVPFQN